MNLHFSNMILCVILHFSNIKIGDILHFSNFCPKHFSFPQPGISDSTTSALLSSSGIQKKRGNQFHDRFVCCKHFNTVDGLEFDIRLGHHLSEETKRQQYGDKLFHIEFYIKILWFCKNAKKYIESEIIFPFLCRILLTTMDKMNNIWKKCIFAASTRCFLEILIWKKSSCFWQ